MTRVSPANQLNVPSHYKRAFNEYKKNMALIQKSWEQKLAKQIAKKLHEAGYGQLKLFDKPIEQTSIPNAELYAYFLQREKACQNLPIETHTYINNGQAENEAKERYLYVMPVGLALISAAEEEVAGLLTSLDPKNIQKMWELENCPAIHELMQPGCLISPTLETVSDFLFAQVPTIFEETFKVFREAAETELPFILSTDPNSTRVLCIGSHTQITPQLLSPSTAYSGLTYIEALESKRSESEVIAIEGAQGSGKTTQVGRWDKENPKQFAPGALYKLLDERGIPIASPISPKNDPMNSMKLFEKEQLLLPGQRQHFITSALSQRHLHAAWQKGYLGLLDRSPLSILMTHLTLYQMFQSNDVEKLADAELIKCWFTQNPSFKKILTVVLNQTDSVHSFFRMRKDPAKDNQEATLVTQTIERIFYKILTKAGLAIQHDIPPEQTASEVAEAIMNQLEKLGIRSTLQKTRNSREWIRKWLGEKNRIGVWYSTRLVKEMNDEQALEYAKNLIGMKPDILFVGASAAISSRDQYRAVELCKQAREELKLDSRQTMIFDWPSNPVYITKNGDVAVVMDYINGQFPQEISNQVVFDLHESKLPYIICGYALFDGTDSPSVAYTGQITPWPSERPYVAKQGLTTQLLTKKPDLIFLDNGSDANSVLPSAAIESLCKTIQSCDSPPPVMIGGGIKSPEQAQRIFNTEGINLIAIGTIAETNLEQASEIVKMVQQSKLAFAS